MSEVTDAAALALKANGTVAVSEIIKTDDGREFVARKNDVVLDHITPLHKSDVYLPKIISQSVNLTDSISMAHYMNRFKNDDSLMFADIKSDTITGAIDYHTSSVAAPASARLVKHTARLTLPFSKEWETWIGRNERMMTHVDFAAFLEENSFDVTTPAGADLLEMCRDLQVRSNMNFSSAIRMGDAVSISFQKDDDATTKQNMTLPVDFFIHIPVYFNEPPVEVRCMMRRKIADGGLQLGYKMIRAENIRQADFQRIVTQIEAETGLAAISGSMG